MRSVLPKQLLLLALLFITSSFLSQEILGPVASYYFYGNARDTVGENHGIVRGAALTKDRFGNFNSAYNFDGLNDHINLGTSTRLKQVTMSISLWAKINNYITKKYQYNNQPFIYTKVRDTVEFYEAYFVGMYLGNNKFDAASTSSVQRQIASISGVVAEIDKWYHIVYMFDADTTYLYVNGKLEQKNFKGFFTSYLETDSVVLGYIGFEDKINNERTTYAWLNGCLDDIKLYDRVLTLSEVEALYNEPNPLFGIKVNSFKKESDLIFFLKQFWYIPIFLLAIIIGIIVFFRWRIKAIQKRDKERNELQNQLMQMEMQALRSQMNPHFIFNAINSIQHYVLTNEKDLANKYLVKFARLMRNVLELTKQELVHINDEIETIKLYVEIEALRFEDIFSFKLNIAPGLENSKIQVPPLIIQPFVENAIWHGLLLKEGQKELTINIFGSDGELIIEVEDNGIGREAAKEFDKNKLKGKSFGMEITKDRLGILEKMIGTPIHFKIIDKTMESDGTLGTKVIITVKLKNQQV